MNDDDRPSREECNNDLADEKVTAALREYWTEDSEGLTFEEYDKKYRRDVEYNLADAEEERSNSYRYYGVNRSDFG
jgi:hypothetical protein